MGDWQGETAPQRPRVGVWWIVLCAVLLPAGWLGSISILLAASFGPDEERPSPGDQLAWSVVLTVLSAGIPIAVAVTYLVWRRRGRLVSLVTPVACFVFAAATLLTTGLGTVSFAHRYGEDVHIRAQPLTSVETSRTQNEVDGDMSRLRERLISALDVDDVETFDDYDREPCRLSNTEWGTRSTLSWPSYEDDPFPDVDYSADQLAPDEVTSRTQEAAAVLEDEGMTIEPIDRGFEATGTGWLADGTVAVTKTATYFELETTCLEGKAPR